MSEPPAPQTRPKWPLVVGCLGCAALAACLVVAGALALFVRGGKGRALATVSGGRIEIGDVALTFPQGAIAADMEIVRSPGEAPPSPDANVRFASRAVSLEATTSTFQKEVELELPYDPALVPADRVKGLRAAHWTGRSWRFVETTVDTARHRLKAKTTHLSLWTAAYESEPRVTLKSHATLPFDICVVTGLGASATDAKVAAIESALALGFKKLTDIAGVNPFQLGPPPYDKDRRLVLLLTNVKTENAKALGLEDDLIVLQHDADAPEGPWTEVVHEFVHAIQHRYRRQAGGDLHSWKSWIGEATATFLATAVAQAKGIDKDQIAPGREKNFCYVPLLDLGQKYEGQLFIAFAVSKLGAGLVNTIFKKAYTTRDGKELPVLEDAIREVSGGKETVGSLYKDFVVAFEYERKLGGWTVYGRTPHVIDPFASRDLAVAADGAEQSVALEGKELCVPPAVKLSIPKPATPGPRSLVLTLAGEDRWLWAFAKSGAGHRLLGGAADRLTVRLEESVEEVVVLPVSLKPQALTLAAKLDKDAAPPPANLLKLRWTKEEATYSTILPAYCVLEIAGSPGDPAAKKLREEIEKYDWVALRVQVDGKTFHSYSRVTPGSRQSCDWDTWIPVTGKGPKKVVVSVTIAGQTLTAERTFAPEAEREAYAAQELAGARTQLAAAKKGLAEIEAKRQEGDEDLYKWARGAVAGAHLSIGNALADQGDVGGAQGAWSQADAIKPNYSAHSRARLALSRGELDVYETQTRAAGQQPDYDAVARAAVLHHDDLERAWKIIESKQADRAPLFGYIPMREHKVAR